MQISDDAAAIAAAILTHAMAARQAADGARFGYDDLAADFFEMLDAIQRGPATQHEEPPPVE